MSRSDEYRKNAEECRRMASQTRKPDDEAAWLRLAYSWLKMLRGEAAAATEVPVGEPANGREPVPSRTTEWPDPDPRDSLSSH